jgi:nucleoside-diphosphate-sugar epimerase
MNFSLARRYLPAMPTSKILVTGSTGHLGEGLVRVLRDEGHAVTGLDLLGSPFTDAVGSITNRALVRSCLSGVTTVFHTAALHKPHVATHGKQVFVDTNVTGTLVLLEEAAAAGVRVFVFTSTTSAFGRALSAPTSTAASWIDESVVALPKNIYGVTKTAAEDVCELAHREHGLAIVVLRTSRFFPELDDREEVRARYADANIKVNEYLYRRVEIDDVVRAHLLAMKRAGDLGFAKYVISATSPFTRDDLAVLAHDAPSLVRRLVPQHEAVYEGRGWKMFPAIDRVYDNARARADLGWTPRYDFAAVVDALAAGEDARSPLARALGR